MFLLALGAFLLLMGPVRTVFPPAEALAWLVVAVAGLLFSIGLLIESTNMANTEVTANETAFAAWYGFVDVLFTALALLAAAWIVLAIRDVMAAEPLTPRWAAMVGALGSAAFLVYFALGHMAKIQALAAGFVTILLALLWFAWVGISLARAKGRISGAAKPRTA